MTIKITEEEYNDMRGNGGGFCLDCGIEAFGIEPDARNYTCDDCEADEVFGIEELLMMGKIEIS